MKLLIVVVKKLTFLLLISLFFHLPGSIQSAEAALMKPESILFQILEKNRTIYQFYLEVKVAVFDPEAFASLSEEADIDLKPYEIPEQSYKQNIVFVRDEFISIETLDETDKVLHIYINELGGSTFAMNLDTARVFITEDIFFPCLIFYTKHIAQLEKRLHQYEITPNLLQYNRQQRLMLYRLGTESNNLQVDPNTFKVLELRNQVQIQGRYYPLKITFSEWNREREQIPDLTKFYVHSRLFKESRIINIQFSRIYTKRNQVLKKYKSLIPPQTPFSTEINYGR